MSTVALIAVLAFGLAGLLGFASAAIDGLAALVRFVTRRDVL